ncbi:hypothetical protein DSC45_23585 [Streptomyces sp. YIM 130001]|uniref:hypothetical protein n=1 Tax=Streptomyces sp. YIM 130001 TaxID=2259644 RepID=UPI000E65D2DB|nr:hypothetical protein [Streptomyces sp. YIM 130001]RII13335.1 hypothetical protein DSC45_23585 [Streptomyces sp. YIM 130001]
MRLSAILSDLIGEWLVHQPDSTWSPDRIDASVLMAEYLLGPPSSAKPVSTPKGSRKEIAARNGRAGARIGKRSY